MKKITISTAIAMLAVAALFAGCKKEDEPGQNARHVYTMSNQVSGNSILVFERKEDGSLQFEDSVATGGKGTGAALGSQGALALSNDQNWLFAVNAGSNAISAFRLKCRHLQRTCTVNSGGTMPVSITSYRHLVYVLNAGSTPTIAGYYLLPGGELTPIPNSIKPINDKVSAPAQLSFSDDGAALVITDKAANNIVSFNITAAGTPGERHEISSASATPFGFAVGKQGSIFVSEATQSALSVYRVTDTEISLVDGPVPDQQKAACWVVLTKDGRYAYVANAASNTISGYRVSSSYAVTLLDADGVTATTGNGPIDQALSCNSKFLYVLNSGSHTIRAFAINSTGGLAFVSDAGDLPIGAGGLAAE